MLVNGLYVDLQDISMRSTSSAEYFLFYYKHFVLQENITTIIAYVVESHIDAFEDISYVETFKGLQLRYEQENDRLKECTNDRFLLYICSYYIFVLLIYLLLLFLLMLLTHLSIFNNYMFYRKLDYKSVE